MVENYVLAVPNSDLLSEGSVQMPMENLDNNYDNIAAVWGFEDTEDEIRNEDSNQRNPIIPPNNMPLVTNRNEERRNTSGRPVQLQWEKINSDPQPHIFTSSTGVSEDVLGKQTELDFFSIYFPDSFIKLVKKETNRYAYSIIRSIRRKNKLKANFIWHTWKPVNIMEIYHFFSIILHMCILPKPHMKDFWSKNEFIHSTFAAKLMTRDRFLSIFSMLHLNNNVNYTSRDRKNYDSLFKIRPYIDLINKKSVISYQPGQN